jgi:hypothetical protein
MNSKDLMSGVDEKAVEELELKLGFMLPLSYRIFLLRSNGGSPASNMEIDVPGLPESPTDVQEFFGFNKKMQGSNILWSLSLMQEIYPDQTFLPIASDSGGSFFCLSFLGSKEPVVVFCDLTVEEAPIYPLAKDFDHFISLMREYKI